MTIVESAHPSNAGASVSAAPALPARRLINPWTWQDELGYAQAVEVRTGTHTLHCAGQAAIDAAGRPCHAGNMPAQAAMAFDNLLAVLERAGYTAADVVRLNYYVTDTVAFFAGYPAIVERLQALGCRPASTLLQVAGLAFTDLMIEIEAVAVR